MIKVIYLDTPPDQRTSGPGSRSAHRIAECDRFDPMKLGQRAQKKRGKKIKRNRKWSALAACSRTSSRQRYEATAYWTQLAVAVADPHGTTVVWHSWTYLNNKPTSAGIARIVLPHVAINVKRRSEEPRFDVGADLWDGRIRRPKRREAAWEALRAAFAASLSAVDRLGALVWEEVGDVSVD